MLKKINPGKGLNITAGETFLAPLLREMAERERLLVSVKPLLPNDLRAHCSQATIDGDCLLLFADSPVWAAKIRLFAQKIPPILTERGVRLKRCLVRVAPPLVPTKALPFELTNESTENTGHYYDCAAELRGAESRGQQADSKSRPRLSAATAAHLEQAAKSIADTQIAACFERIARHHGRTRKLNASQVPDMHGQAEFLRSELD